MVKYRLRVEILYLITFIRYKTNGINSKRTPIGTGFGNRDGKTSVLMDIAYRTAGTVINSLWIFMFSEVKELAEPTVPSGKDFMDSFYGIF